MVQTKMHSDKLRRSVITLFFTGLLSMAIFAICLGRVCTEWGSFQFGLFTQPNDAGSAAVVPGNRCLDGIERRSHLDSGDLQWIIDLYLRSRDTRAG